jgi:CBS domain-containing protein
MLVSDILRQKGSVVVTVEPGLTVEALVSLLAEHRIGAVVVSSDGTSVDGIVSERDVVSALAAQGTDALASTVGAICTSEVSTALPSDRLDHLMAVMTAGRFRHLPVVVDGALQGIISIGDVVKARMGELEEEQKALTTYIQSGG